MALVDDPAIVRALSRIAILPLDRSFHRTSELRHQALMDIGIIRRDAGLAAVGKLPPGDPSCRLAASGGLRDDDRSLAAELERNRGKMFGRRGHYDLTDCRAAGEKDMIEGQFEKF